MFECVTIECMTWDFKTDADYQEKLDWVDTFLTEHEARRKLTGALEHIVENE